MKMTHMNLFFLFSLILVVLCISLEKYILVVLCVSLEKYIFHPCNLQKNL